MRAPQGSGGQCPGSARVRAEIPPPPPRWTAGERGKRSPGFSLLDQILAHIQGAGKEDDAALDDVEQVLVDADHVQANEDQTQHQNADDDAADLADAADEGDAADDAGRDGVGLVVVFPKSSPVFFPSHLLKNDPE